MADIETIIKDLAMPIVDELGIDWMGVVLSGSRESRLLRVVVDKKGGVGVEALRRLSKGLSLQLDVEDLMPGEYHLEISSPGLDWPLTTVADFVRYEHEWLSVKFENGTTLEGENLGVDAAGEVLSLKIRGEEKKLELAETSLVIRAVNWGGISGEAKRKKSKSKKKFK